jgi:hypothetical protein
MQRVPQFLPKYATTVQPPPQAAGYRGYNGYDTTNARPQQTVAELLSGQAIQSEALGEMPPDLAGAQNAAGSKRKIADMLMGDAMNRQATDWGTGLASLGEAFIARRANSKADTAEEKYQQMVQALTQKAAAGDEASIAMLLSPEAAIGRSDTKARQGIEDARYTDERDYGRGRDAIGDERWDKGWNREGEWHEDATDFRDTQATQAQSNWNSEFGLRKAESEAERKAATAAQQPVPGLPPPNLGADLPPGVVGVYARADEKAINDARDAAAASRERARMTGKFAEDAEGYWAQGEGIFNDIGQALSMRTTGLKATTSKLGPQSRPEGSGSTSDKDMAIYMQSTVNVNNTPGTNKDIHAMESGLADQDAAYVEWLNTYQAAYPQPGSSRTAKALWDQYINAQGNELFSRTDNGRVQVNTDRPDIMTWLSQQQGAAPAANGAGPAAGTVVNGYRFKGGDPNDKNNWERQ